MATGTNQPESESAVDARERLEFALCYAATVLSIIYCCAGPANYPGRSLIEIIRGMPRELSGWVLPISLIFSFFWAGNAQMGERNAILLKVLFPIAIVFSTLFYATLPTFVIGLSFGIHTPRYEGREIDKTICNSQQLAKAVFALYDLPSPGVVYRGYLVRRSKLGDFRADWASSDSVATSIASPVRVLLLSGTEFGPNRPTGLFADALAHAGYATPYLNEVRLALRRVGSDDAPVFVAGHSLGGMVAQLIPEASIIVTFGSPQIVDSQQQFVRRFAVRSDPIPYFYTTLPGIRAVTRTLHNPLRVFEYAAHAIDTYRSAITYIDGGAGGPIGAHLRYPTYASLSRYDVSGVFRGDRCIVLASGPTEVGTQ